MKKIENIYTTAVANACDICGVNYTSYLECRREAAVDARMLVVGWMVGYGVTEATLAYLTGWSQQRINYLKKGAADRLFRRMFKANYEELTAAMTASLAAPQTANKQPTNK